MLGRPEVLGEPPLGGEARVLDLAVAVEQHDCGARRRIGRERADEAPARLRGPQRVLQAGAHEIEDVTVALGELKLGPAEPGDDHLTTPRADADRDPVLDAGSVEQVAVQLAAGQAAGLDGLGEAQRRTPTRGMREQERMTTRVAHELSRRRRAAPPRREPPRGGQRRSGAREVRNSDPTCSSDSETARHRPCGVRKLGPRSGQRGFAGETEFMHPTRFASEGLERVAFHATSRSSRPSASLATRGVGRARLQIRVGSP